MERILLVEDDGAIAMGLEYSLAQEGYQVTVRGDCPAPWRLWSKRALICICWT